MPDNPPQSALASQRTLWFVGTAIGLAAAIGLLVLGPGEGSPCLIRAATGLACPGCGMTRATAALLRGDWTAMWTFHPLAPFFGLQSFVVWSWWGWVTFLRRARVPETVLFWLFLGDFGILAVVWVVRLVAGTLPR